MKIIGLDGRKYNWPPVGHSVGENDSRNRSEYHIRARALLKRMFPTQRVLEEVPLLGSSLTADFFVPLQSLMIECQGEQHYKYIPHFHGNKLGFFNGKKNDTKKLEWCNTNNIKLVELPYDESDEQWEKRIVDSRTTHRNG
jgi:hypothetical protein